MLTEKTQDSPIETGAEGPTLLELLQRDHRRLDGALVAACQRMDEGRPAEAYAALATFARELDGHRRCEEEILIPLYEARAWQVARLTAVLRHEHREAQGVVVAMAGALAHGDGAEFARQYRHLRALLPAHHIKEERVFYPALERALSPTERRELAGRFARGVVEAGERTSHEGIQE